MDITGDILRGVYLMVENDVPVSHVLTNNIEIIVEGEMAMRRRFSSTSNYETDTKMKEGTAKMTCVSFVVTLPAIDGETLSKYESLDGGGYNLQRIITYF